MLSTSTCSTCHCSHCDISISNISWRICLWLFSRFGFTFTVNVGFEKELIYLFVHLSWIPKHLCQSSISGMTLLFWIVGKSTKHIWNWYYTVCVLRYLFWNRKQISRKETTTYAISKILHIMNSFSALKLVSNPLEMFLQVHQKWSSWNTNDFLILWRNHKWV